MSTLLTKAVRFLAILGGVALMLTGECQPLFLIVFGSFFLIGIPVKNSTRLSPILSRAQPVLALIIFILALVDFFYLSNSFLLTVAHFLLALQGVRMLSLQTNRENLGSVLISSLMILSASTLSVEWTYFVMLFAYIAAVIWTLMLYTLLEDNRMNAASLSIIKEKTMLWFSVMAGIRVSAVVAVFITIGCCAVVFVVFPRFNFQGFRGQFLQPVHKTGFTSQVDLTGNERIFVDDSIVMRIEINPKDRARWSGYIRGRALDSFDGKIWKKSPEHFERVYRAGWKGGINLPISDETPRDLLHQSIYLESMDSPLIFAAPRPVTFKIDRPYLDVSQDGSIQRGNGDAWRFHYEVDSFPSQLDPMYGFKRANTMPSVHLSKRQIIPARLQKIIQQSSAYQDPERELLYVPDSMRVKLTELFHTIVGQRSPQDPKSLEQIMDYFRKSYSYSLQGQQANHVGEDPLVDFIFKGKKGHCEYFAAAMCLLLRSQKVPARMATGFLSQEWNPRGHYVIVRMKHAHAWVEAFIAPYGWIGFDPSPAEALDGNQREGLLLRWSELMDYINLRWNRYILSYDLEKQVEIVKTVSQHSMAISIKGGNLGTWFRKVVMWIDRMKSSVLQKEPTKKNVKLIDWLLLIMVMGFLVGCGWALFYWRSQRTKYVWFYPKLVRYLEKNSTEKTDYHTLQELLHLAAPKLGDKASVASYLTTEYYRIRFDSVERLSSVEKKSINDALHRLTL